MSRCPGLVSKGGSQRDVRKRGGNEKGHQRKTKCGRDIQEGEKLTGGLLRKGGGTESFEEQFGIRGA